MSNCGVQTDQFQLIRDFISYSICFVTSLNKLKDCYIALKSSFYSTGFWFIYKQNVKKRYIVNVLKRFIYNQLKGPALPGEFFFFFILKKMFEFFQPIKPTATHKCLQKISAHSVQPFGRLQGTYLYTNVLFYYIDKSLTLNL